METYSPPSGPWPKLGGLGDYHQRGDGLKVNVAARFSLRVSLRDRLIDDPDTGVQPAAGILAGA
jgi:hypothetical protein